RWLSRDGVGGEVRDGEGPWGEVSLGGHGERLAAGFAGRGTAVGVGRRGDDQGAAGAADIDVGQPFVVAGRAPRRVVVLRRIVDQHPGRRPTGVVQRDVVVE